MLLKCTCKNDTQDTLYGRGFRIHNACFPKKLPERWYRCTVCSGVKMVGKERK